MPAARATNDGRMKTPLIGGGTLRKRSQAKAAVVATPPTVAAAKRSRPREGTPGPDLSSIGSPLKTPAPVNYTRQPPVQASTLPPIIPPTAAIENDNTSTKIEAWTSKFVVRNSGAPSSLVTAAAVAVPDARNLAVINTDMPVHRTLPIVEIPLPLPPSGEHEPGEANPRSTPTTTLPPILTTAATPIRTVPPPDVTAVEFVPPPTVTRRMASVRHQLPNLHPHNSHNFHKPQQQPPSLPQGGRTDGIPADYAESPLTRARRIDAQNTWREAQLKTFLAAKADMVKMALGSLRSGGREREEAQLQGQGPTPTQAQATNQEQQVDRASDAEQGVEGEREGEERGKVKRGNTLKASPLPSPASASKISPRSGKGGAPEETVSISASVPAVDPEIIARLPALKVIDESDDSHKCAFIAEEQPPLTTSTVAAGALNDDLIFDFDPSSMIRPASHSPIAAVAAASPSSSTRRGGSSGRGLPNLPSTESLPGPTMMIAMDGGEAERRRRLKERNERAVEKKKLLLQKAQQIRSQTVANLSGKPKELPSGRRAVGASTSVSASTSAATLGKSANGAGTSTIKTSTTSSSASTASTVSLQKQAMINSIIAQSKSTAAEAGKGEEITVTTPQKSEGIFKMPLPKVKTPGSATRGGSGDHPSSDDTFTTSAAVISTKTALPPSTTMDMAATVTTAAVSSPKLPQIVEYSLTEAWSHHRLPSSLTIPLPIHSVVRVRKRWKMSWHQGVVPTKAGKIGLLGPIRPKSASPSFSNDPSVRRIFLVRSNPSSLKVLWSFVPVFLFSSLLSPASTSTSAFRSFVLLPPGLPLSPC